MALAELNIPVPPNADVKFTRFERINADEMAEKQLKAQDSLVKTRARMSWTDMGRMPPKGPKTVGRVDKNYPYSLVEGRFYVQNCKVFLGNGLTEIDPYTYEFAPGDPFETERLRARVLDAYKSYNGAALEEDPLLCPYCLAFHAQSPLEFADHIVGAHADKYGQHLGYGQTSTPPPPEVKISHMPPVPETYVATTTVPISTVKDETGHPASMKRERPPMDLSPLVCVKPCNCGKTFMGPAALKRHITGFNKRSKKA